MGFSRPEYWSGEPFSSPGDLPNPGVEPRSPTLQVDSLPAEPQGTPKNTGVCGLSLLQWIFLTQELNQGFLHCRQIVYLDFDFIELGTHSLAFNLLATDPSVIAHHHPSLGYPGGSAGKESACNAGDPG